VSFCEGQLHNTNPAFGGYYQARSQLYQMALPRSWGARDVFLISQQVTDLIYIGPGVHVITKENL
jgi:hypothetical protein